jgi:predicted Zn-dependent protease
MRRTIAVARGPEMIHLGFSTIIALGLILFTAACGDETGGESNLVDVVSAAELPAATTPTIVPAESGSIPVSPTVTYAEAESVFAARRYGEATEMFAVIAGRRPGNAWGHYMHGLSAWKAGNNERAESAFLAALERDSNHVKTRINLARVLIEQGRPKDALGHVEKALSIDTASADGFRLLGRVRGELKEIGPGVEAYRKAISLNERDVWSMNNMAFLLIRDGQFEEAIGPLARAIELDPTSAVFQNNLGMALERTGRYRQATEAYRSALLADSTYGKAIASLARLEVVKQDPAIVPADLPALAKTFAESVKPSGQLDTPVVAEPVVPVTPVIPPPGR